MRAGAPASAAALAAAVTILAVSAAPAVPAAASPPRPDLAARLDVGGPALAARGVVVNYPARRARLLPRVPASAYIIADASTGAVLAARDPHGEFAPASTLKMLTAITMIPRLKPKATVLATRQATSVVPNVVGLIRGRRYQVASLFTALLLISANDAAVALTQAAGSFGRGMALINAEARHLQAYDVVARRPNGLPAAGQVVSAYDEALIARQALATPAFMHYDSMLAARFRVKPRHWVTLVNQNTLLTQYRGGLGGKIGWTDKSKATYVGMARRHGVTLIVAVLHCKPLREIISGERLLNWGFAMDGRVRPVGTLVAPLAAGVTGPEPAPSPPAASAAASSPAAAAARAARALGRQRGRAVPLGSPAETRASGTDAGLALGAGVLAAAILGLVGRVRARRRRLMPGRRRAG